MTDPNREKALCIFADMPEWKLDDFNKYAKMLKITIADLQGESYNNQHKALEISIVFPAQNALKTARNNSYVFNAKKRE